MELIEPVFWALLAIAAGVVAYRAVMNSGSSIDDPASGPQMYYVPQPVHYAPQLAPHVAYHEPPPAGDNRLAVFEAWFSQRLYQDPEARVLATMAYEDYSQCLMQHGHHPATQQRFGGWMTGKINASAGRLRRQMSTGIYYYCGVNLYG